MLGLDALSLRPDSTTMTAIPRKICVIVNTYGQGHSGGAVEASLLTRDVKNLIAARRKPSMGGTCVQAR